MFRLEPKRWTQGDRAQVQTVRVNLRSAGAMGVQTCAHYAQEDTQCRVERTLVALQVIAQAFADRQHPLVHWQAREYGVAQVRCSLCHAPGVARGADSAPLQEEATR